MKKNSILNNFEFPELTTEVKRLFKGIKIKDQSVVVIKAETKKIDNEMVDIVTYYIKDRDYHKKIRYRFMRLFISKNDFLYQYYLNGSLYTGKRNIYDFFWNATGIIADESARRVLDKLLKKLHLTDETWYEKHPERIADNVINMMRTKKSNKRAKTKRKKEKSQTKIDMLQFKHINPFTSAKVKKEAVKKFPVYFFETEGVMYCTYCHKDTELDKLDKHKTVRRCPKCKIEGTVQRVSQCKSIFMDHHYMIEPEITDNKVMINYHYCRRTILKDDFRKIDVKISNDYRKIIDANNYKIYRYYRHGNHYMPIHSICHTGFDKMAGVFRNYENKYYCGRGYLTSDTYDVILKSSGFDYYNKYWLREEERINITSEDYYSDVLEALYLYHNGEITEKIVKYGLESLAKDFQKDAWLRPSIDLNYKETELNKIFKVTKPMMKFIKEESLDWYDVGNMQKISANKVPFIPERAKICKDTIGLSYYNNYWNKVKLLNYFKKQHEMGNEITPWEYVHYITNLKSLNMPMYKSYLYPKNFYEYDGIMSRKIDDVINADQVKAIHRISEGLRNMNGIEHFMKGSKGLLVKVPESPADLREEGKFLDNCIGSYVSRVANGNTFIFFIRQIDAPDKAFFAMEYHDGVIRQIHGFKNKNPNNEIKSFCKSFADFLKISKFEPSKFIAA